MILENRPIPPKTCGLSRAIYDLEKYIVLFPYLASSLSHSKSIIYMLISLSFLHKSHILTLELNYLHTPLHHPFLTIQLSTSTSTSPPCPHLLT